MYKVAPYIMLVLNNFGPLTILILVLSELFTKQISYLHKHGWLQESDTNFLLTVAMAIGNENLLNIPFFKNLEEYINVSSDKTGNVL